MREWDVVEEICIGVIMVKKTRYFPTIICYRRQTQLWHLVGFDKKYVKNSSKTSYVITISKREKEIDVKLAQCIDYSWSGEHVARRNERPADSLRGKK